MTVNTPILFSTSNTSPIGALSPHNKQEALPVHSTAHTTRRLDIGGRRMDTIPISEGPIPISSSHGHRRHHFLLNIVPRHDLGKADDSAQHSISSVSLLAPYLFLNRA